jgi:hypothetical protein
VTDTQLQARRDISVAFYCEYAASDFEDARLSGRQVTEMNPLRDEDDILEALKHLEEDGFLSSDGSNSYSLTSKGKRCIDNLPSVSGAVESQARNYVSLYRDEIV